MDTIFHERQEGQLCAQHCLNNLLQGAYFTAVDLADHARELDEAEGYRMAEGPAGVASAEFVRFMQQPSSNMDDSGYFSVQVISKALRVWNLDLITLSSPAMKEAMENPVTQRAFICNHDYHWFTIRKLGLQWFNLDSLHKRPKLISDTYLSLFLTQLQMEGYSLFVVIGSLPACEADELLTLIPVEPEKPVQPHSSGHEQEPQSSSSTVDPKMESREWDRDNEEESDWQLSIAISASLQDQQSHDVPTAPTADSTPVPIPDHKPEPSPDSVSFPSRSTTEQPKLVPDSSSNQSQSQSQSQSENPIPQSEEELRQRRLLHLGVLKPPEDGD